MKKPPCKGCEFRVPLCHSKCDEYLEYKKERESVNNARHQQQFQEFHRFNYWVKDEIGKYQGKR